MFRINEGPLLAHYTAITCSRSFGIGAGIGEINLPIPIRNRYPQYRPIPDTRYRYRSQPN